MGITVSKADTVTASKEHKTKKAAQKAVETPTFEFKQEDCSDKFKTNSPKTKSKECDKENDKGFWDNVSGGVKNFFKSIKNFFTKVFNSKELADKNNKSFQKLKEKGKVEQQGDFQIISSDYIVRRGDTLSRLSREFGTNEEIICNDNRIIDKNKIQTSQTLNIQKLAYKVKDGENLEQIAERYGISSKDIRTLNNIENGNSLQKGQMIEMPGFVYNVSKGDNLTKIAQRVGISVEKLKTLNNLKSDSIYPGQKLIVLETDNVTQVSLNNQEVKVAVSSAPKTEFIEASSKKSDLSTRPLLQKKRIVNGKVAATRAVFEPAKQGKLSGKTIIVNAGHGYSDKGTDCGALGKSGTNDEWLCNYDNAIKLKDKLINQGARVIFLQGHISLIKEELEKRVNNADLFVSVHVNSHNKQTQDRMQIYYSTKDGSKGTKLNAKSKKLAGIMEKNFDRWIPSHEKIAAKDKFVVSGKQDYAQAMGEPLGVCTAAELNQKVPSVLWEVAFMVSPKGRERLNNDNLMNNYAGVMTNSIIEYFS